MKTNKMQTHTSNFTVLLNIEIPVEVFGRNPTVYYVKPGVIKIENLDDIKPKYVDAAVLATKWLLDTGLFDDERSFAVRGVYSSDVFVAEVACVPKHSPPASTRTGRKMNKARN